MRRRAGWSPQDCKEYDTALIEAFESGTTTAERIDALEVILADAVQAHRPWARDIEREALRDGLNKFIVEYGKRRQPDVVLAYNGRVISKPRRRGVVIRLDETGERAYQQELFEDMTWVQFRSLLDNRVSQINSIAEELRVLRRIDQLRQRWPNSAGVAEALHLQGCSLDEWLAAGEVAS
jgi:hypothetical protein